MRQIPHNVAQAAEACLNTDEGKTMMAHMIKEFGLLDRAYIPDAQGKVSPILAAIRDGERGVVGLLHKLQEGKVFDPRT